jgi:pimeloyl-ACP methyl ester carboxylesterase
MECQLADLAVYYETVGQGRPLKTISGIPSDHRIIQSWLEPIFTQRAGWQRFYFDLPGTGQTSGAGITRIDQVLEVVCDFIDAIIPNQPFTLLGLSVGGYLARGVVHRKAALVEGVCLLVPWLSEHQGQTRPSPVTFVRDPELMAQLTPQDAEKLEGLAVVQTKRSWTGIETLSSRPAKGLAHPLWNSIPTRLISMKGHPCLRSRASF